MAQRVEHRSIDDAVELLKDNGFEGLAEAVTVLLNTAMIAERSEYLGAAPGIRYPVLNELKQVLQKRVV